MENLNTPNLKDHLVLEFKVTTEDGEPGWSNTFCWRSAPQTTSPIWVFRLPTWRNHEARPERITSGIFSLTLQLTENHPIELHTFEEQDPSSSLRKLFDWRVKLSCGLVQIEELGIRAAFGTDFCGEEFL